MAQFEGLEGAGRERGRTWAHTLLESVGMLLGFLC